jgi:hypothetical protein
MTKAALLKELEQLSAHDKPGVVLDDIRRKLTSR